MEGSCLFGNFDRKSGKQSSSNTKGKREEYWMYFPFFSPHFRRKRVAAPPQTIYSEFP